MRVQVNYHGTLGATKNMLGWDIAPFGAPAVRMYLHMYACMHACMEAARLGKYTLMCA